MGKSHQVALVMLAFLLVLPTFILPSQAQQIGKFRYYVDVESPGTYEIALDPRNDFPINATLNPLSAVVMGPDGSMAPLSLSFERELPVRLGLEHKNAVSFSSDEGLCFFATGSDSYIKILLERSDLSSGFGFTFKAKGDFRIALRDASLMNEVSSVKISSKGLEEGFLHYNPSSLQRDRPYALFLIPSPILSCISDLKLVSGKLIVRWRAEKPGLYTLSLDTTPFKTRRAHISTAERIEPMKKEAFLVKLIAPSNLSGIVQLKAEVTGNLSPIATVQAKLDYEGQYGWTDDKGVLIDFRPDGAGWIASWNTLTTWDGRHVLVLRAYDRQGRYAEIRRIVWVENVRNGTRLFPNRSSFSFIVMGDNRPSGGAEQPQIYKQLLDHTLKDNPDFYVNVGDVVYSGELREYRDFVRSTSVIRKPLFIAEGNHENQIGKSAQRNFMNFFGKLFYSFDYGNAHLIFLNANVPGFRYSMSDEQIEWLAHDLERTDAEHVFIFIHQPIYPYAHGIEDKYALERLRAVIRTYRDKIDAIFQGHEHMFYSSKEDGIKTFITGGSGAELDPQYPAKHLFFHYLIVRVEGSGVSYELVKPPVLEVEEPPKIVDYPSIEIRGRAQPFATVRVNGKDVRPSKTGAFSFTVSLLPGENEVSIEALYSTRLERRFKITYLPHAEIVMPNDLTSGSEIQATVRCLGKPASGLLILNGKIHNLDNGRVELKLPSVDKNELLRLAAYADDCFPTEQLISVRPQFQSKLVAEIMALIILIVAILLYRWRYSGDSR